MNAQTPEKTRDDQLRKKYGIGLGEARDRLAAQGDRCAICRRAKNGRAVPAGKVSVWDWCVDHDHDTGQVRGILCFHCNAAIGMLGDDPQIVMEAYRYLTSHRMKAPADTRAGAFETSDRRIG